MKLPLGSHTPDLGQAHENISFPLSENYRGYQNPTFPKIPTYQDLSGLTIQ